VRATCGFRRRERQKEDVNNSRSKRKRFLPLFSREKERTASIWRQVSAEAFPSSGECSCFSPPCIRSSPSSPSSSSCVSPVDRSSVHARTHHTAPLALAGTVPLLSFPGTGTGTGTGMCVCERPLSHTRRRRAPPSLSSVSGARDGGRAQRRRRQRPLLLLPLQIGKTSVCRTRSRGCTSAWRTSRSTSSWRGGRSTTTCWRCGSPSSAIETPR